MPEEIARLDAIGLAERIRAGEISPLEAVDQAIARIERLNPVLNAVIHERFERARSEASSAELPDGPFRGVPFLLKDLAAFSAGDPFHQGMRFLRERGWRETRDSFLAARFRAAGLVLLGKTNTPELGLLPTTEPEAFGPTRNPWDLNRSPGGSSGGSAAAVAARLVPAAHGSDGGGSIRIPASACGLVGLKPSRGRITMGPHAGEGLGGVSNEGVLTRSVRDTAALLDVAAGPAPGDPYQAPPPERPYAQEVGRPAGRLRVGLLRRMPADVAPVHADCVAAVDHAARLLESRGHVVEESHPAALDERPEGTPPFLVVWSVRAAAALEMLSRRTGAEIGEKEVEPQTWWLVELGRSFSGTQLAVALAGIHAHTRRLAAWWAEGFDVLLTPTLAEPPLPLGDFGPVPGDPLRGLARAGFSSAFTSPFNQSGQPAISLPLYWTETGMPIGIQLAAAYAREDLLLRLAAELEEASPWADRRPPPQG